MGLVWGIVKWTFLAKFLAKSGCLDKTPPFLFNVTVEDIRGQAEGFGGALILLLLSTSCMTLGKLFNLTQSQFSHL